MLRFLTPIILIIAAIGLFFGFTSGQYAEIQKKQIQQQTTENALSNSRQIGARRDQLNDIYLSIAKNDADRLKKMLPDSVDNVRLILDMDNIASQHGMVLRGVRVGSSAAPGDKMTLAPDNKAWGTLELAFSVTASYGNFRAFLNDLQNSLRLVDIVGLNVRTTKSSVYDYDLVLHTYWLR